MDNTSVLVAGDGNGTEMTVKITGTMINSPSERTIMEIILEEILDRFKITAHAISSNHNIKSTEVLSRVIKIMCQMRKNFIDECRRVEKDLGVELLSNGSLLKSDLEILLEFGNYSKKDLKNIFIKSISGNKVEDVCYQIAMAALRKEMEKREVPIP